MSQRSSSIALTAFPFIPPMRTWGFGLWRFCCAVLLFLLGGTFLHAQSSEGHSFILRMTPGTQGTSVLKQIAAVAPAINCSLSSRPVFPSGQGKNSLLGSNRLDRYLVVDIPNSSSQNADAAFSLLKRIDGVDAVFPNHTYHIDAVEPNDSLYSEQWALQKINALEAWQVTEGDPSMLVGVLDTGIEWDHPDLKGAVWINPAEDLNGNKQFDPWPSDEERDGVGGDLDGIDQDGNGYPDDVIGYDFVDQDVPNVGDWSGRDPLPGDDQGHGTTVSGVLAATKNNRVGIAGIAPGVRLVTLRAFDATGNGQDDDIAAAIVYAADRGLAVLNMSFGDFYRSPLMYDAIRYAYEKGVILVASSGNDGVPDPHYPSSFTEVIGVGATDDGDRLSFFSTYGSQLSLVAPGVDIRTTALGGNYTVVNGTSFSAPYVAGVAALMRTAFPTWTQDEIAASIEAATDDLGDIGWDSDFGAGRLNAAAALHTPGPAVVAITSPLMDEGIDKDALLTVTGSVVAPLLQSWSLEVGQGGLPEEWITIAESNEGILGGVLGTLNTANLPDTLMNLRLRLHLTNGRTIERRTRFFLDRTPPTHDEFTIRNIWRYDRRALAVTLHTDDLTRGVVWVRPSAGNGTWLPVELEPERVGLTRTHYYFITPLEMTPGLPYDLYVELTNAAGGKSLIGSAESPLSAEIEPASFPVSTMRRKGWSLPYSFVLNRKLSLDATGKPEILLNRFNNFAFDRMVLYRFSDDQFVPVDSAGNWIPRGVGDTDGDGLREVLGQSSQTGIVYEQKTSDGSPFASVMYADTTSRRFYPGAFYDFDGDGRDELVGYTSEHDSTEQYYFVASWDGSKYVEQARLPNTTLPEPGFTRNVMGASDVVIGDFNHNGKVDLLFGDSDGDFMVYERESATSYKVLWVDEHDGNEADRMIAAGDIDNDGIDELVVAWRASTAINPEDEYDPPLWNLKVVRLEKQGGVSTVAEEAFAFVRNSNPFRPGLEVGDLDGKPGKEIALSIFPSMYVLRWDSSLKKLRPFWWRGNSIINRPVIQDFNGDGRNELGVGDGDEILFYQIDSLSDAPSPPAGAQGWALDDSTTQLDWEPVPNANSYNIYRAVLDNGPGPINFQRVGVTSSVNFIDTGHSTQNGRLELGTTYGYVITAVDSDAANSESNGSGEVEVLMHSTARLMSGESVNSREIRLEMSGRVGQALYRSGALDVRTPGGESVSISSVLTVGERSLLLAFNDEHYDVALTVRPTYLFRDYYHSPVDTTITVTVSMPARVDTQVFIASRAAPVEGEGIGVEFSLPVDPITGSNPANYTLDPPGAVLAARIDPNDPRQVLLTLEDSYPLGPYGYEYLVTIRDVLASDGRSITTGAGSVVGFTISADELDDLFVYPHPFSISRDHQVTFAGLTQRAAIRIYTQSGALLRELQASGGDGGMTWDGTDAKGGQVPSGIYLYSVVAFAPNGKETESRLRKIAVLP